MSTSSDRESHEDSHQFSDPEPDSGSEEERDSDARFSSTSLINREVRSLRFVMRHVFYVFRKQNYVKLCEQLKPMAQLPLALRLDRESYNPWHDRPHYVCFGFGVTYRQLVDYALQVGILTPSSPAWKHSPAAFQATMHLAKVALVELDMRSIYHPTYYCCVCLYSNYTQQSKELVDEDEKEVLDIIREELKIPDDEAPMWYFQMTDME